MKKIEQAELDSRGIPMDAMDVWKDGSWTILVFRGNQSAHFEATDYHSEPLKLTKQELHDLGKMSTGRIKWFQKHGY